MAMGNAALLRHSAPSRFVTLSQRSEATLRPPFRGGHAFTVRVYAPERCRTVPAVAKASGGQVTVLDPARSTSTTSPTDRGALLNDFAILVCRYDAAGRRVTPLRDFDKVTTKTQCPRLRTPVVGCGSVVPLSRSYVEARRRNSRMCKWIQHSGSIWYAVGSLEGERAATNALVEGSTTPVADGAPEAPVKRPEQLPTTNVYNQLQTTN